MDDDDMRVFSRRLAPTLPLPAPTQPRGESPAGVALLAVAGRTAPERSLPLDQRVRQLVSARVATLVDMLGVTDSAPQLAPGKMLRTRLAAAIHSATDTDIATLANVCAGVEMAHTATLCHDDVIDNAFIRRSLPALWRVQTASAAILIGDALLCQSMFLVSAAAEGRFVTDFLSKVWEVCQAEVRQDLLLRGSQLSPAACLQVARGKTGPLFAFAAAVAAGDNLPLVRAAEEAGYCIGTAYQLADDLLDTTGREEAAGKTLGTDRVHGKYTLAATSADGADLAANAIHEQLTAAVRVLRAWPAVQAAVARFIDGTLIPLFERQTATLGLKLAVGTP